MVRSVYEVVRCTKIHMVLYFHLILLIQGGITIVSEVQEVQHEI